MGSLQKERSWRGPVLVSLCIFGFCVFLYCIISVTFERFGCCSAFASVGQYTTDSCPTESNLSVFINYRKKMD